MANKTKPVIAILEIKHCQSCPFLDMKRHYTADSFEHAHNWFCKKKKGKKIAGHVDWYEEEEVKIPEWCPIKK